MPRCALLLCGLMVGAFACDDADDVMGGLDQGVRLDAARLDAAPTDAAQGSDAAQRDAAEPDAAKPDAAEPDAAEPDAAEPDAAEPDAAEPDAQGDQAQPQCVAGVVNFVTEDGLTLVADLYPKPGATRGAILLHMIPPNNDRSNYPAAFIEALNAEGFTVLNVDRRGAGDSEGVARDAYEGPLGRLDAVAARDYLLGAGCGTDPSKIALVGASNGTTTMLDYTAPAPEVDRPAAMVLLTGGRYTENQTAIADHRALFEAQRMLFAFSTDERAWSASFSAGAPNTWQFNEYPNGAHGTLMFGAEPSSVEDVVGWLGEAVTP